jgi:hypothetical protein
MREHMASVEGGEMLGDPDTHVEIGKTFMGGVKKGKRNRGSAAKTVLIDEMVTAPVPNQRKAALQPFVESNVTPV